MDIMNLPKKERELVISMLEQLKKRDTSDDNKATKKLDLFNSLYNVTKKELEIHEFDINFELYKLIAKESTEGEITIRTSLSVFTERCMAVFKLLTIMSDRVQIMGDISDESVEEDTFGISEISFLFEDLYKPADKYINDLELEFSIKS